jgi:hypothetical protein
MDEHYNTLRGWHEQDQEIIIYRTQGGGTVMWDGLCYRFVEPPENFPRFKPGDKMPEEWGIA